MNTDKIKIFLDLAESLNFSRTAQNMNITQSAVSQSISSLERYLNTKLFYRSRKEVNLTPAGQLFYQGMQPLITQFNKAVTHAREVAQSVNTLLTIGFSGSGYDRYAINQLIHEYRKVRPEVKIFLENYDHRTMVARLKQGFCDVILTGPESIDSGITLTYDKLLEARFYAVCSKNYCYMGNSPVTMKDLSKERLIFLDNSWCLPKQNSLQNALSRDLASLDYAVANNMADYTQMISAGLGIGICADFVVDPSDDQLELFPLEKEVTDEIGIVTLKDRKSPAADFIAWVKERGLPATRSQNKELERKE